MFKDFIAISLFISKDGFTFSLNLITICFNALFLPSYMDSSETKAA